MGEKNEGIARAVLDMLTADMTILYYFSDLSYKEWFSEDVDYLDLNSRDNLIKIAIG